MNVKRLESSEGCVWKYVFDFGDAIAEAVLYKYNSFEERTVICCSVQSGCPVGCIFCGTGNHFVRNLTSEEIVSQIKYVLKDMDIEDINSKSEKFQIMFMSMGEPFLNYNNVESAILKLNSKYGNADLLVSTIGILHKDWARFIKLSMEINKIGLQFSLHSGYENERNRLIPFKRKLDIRQIRDMASTWNGATNRPVYFNYCVTEDNMSAVEAEKIKDLFSPIYAYFTFSVVCSPDENMKEKGHKGQIRLDLISNSFLEDGYNVRQFDPAGQDDIGGGCGQLWFVQEWLKTHDKKISS